MSIFAVLEASVLETPKDHLPCFWSKDISGSPFSPELDVNEILPDITREQQKALKSVRKGPITSRYEMDNQESDTNQFLKELNNSQREACKEALEKESGVVLVQGPPGTGKTKTIASLIMACAANRQRVLTCGPTNVAAMETAVRTEQMVQSRGGMFRRAQICIVASEDRVGITMDHPLSELMLDHRKKRVKRVAKAGLRDLVPMLRDILDTPRKVFQTWRNCALSGEDAYFWAATSAKVAQTKLPTREVIHRNNRGERFPAPDKESVPPDTDEAFRTFLSTQAFEAIEDILKWQQEHLTSSLPKLPQHLDNLDHEEGDPDSKKLPEQLQELQRTMERVRDIVRAMRTALQRGQAPEADEREDPWEHMGTASRDLDRAVKDWAAVCHDVSKANSEELRSHILEGAQIIFSTTTVAGRVRVWQQKIPNVILDEACQCRELETMVVMRRHVQRLILVGDPEQLPSTVFSKKAKEIGFDRSLFERLVEIGRRKHTLARQYRMLPQIADFPNVTFYDSQVVNDDTVKIMDQRIEDYINAPDQKWNFHTPMRLYDTGNGDYEEMDKANMARSNPREAELFWCPLEGPMKKSSKGSAPAAATVSQQELFWDSLYGEDLQLARATGCSCAADLEREKQKKQERQAKADAAQKQNLRENEWKRQKEKEEEKKQREKNREENKWKKQFEIAKKQAFSEGVLQAYDYGDGVWWVQCEDKRWQEVQGEYYCPLCNKHLNESSLELHINSDAHKKKVAWSSGSSALLSAPSMPLAAPRAINTAVVKRDAPLALAEWQTMGPDGLVRCIPCNKVVDDNHISTGDHLRRLESWLAHEQLKKTGYAAPALEYLAYVPSVAGDDASERWLKCLLCGKFVQDDTSHSGTKENPQGSNQHKKNLTNYVGTAWYQENVIKERLKWHPAPTVRCTPAPKPAPAPTRWATAAPTTPGSYCGGRAPAAPVANAQPAWLTEDPPAAPVAPVADPWNDEEDTKITQVPYPSSSETRLPSADAAAEGEGEEFEC
eukprot:s577_g7.t2